MTERTTLKPDPETTTLLQRLRQWVAAIAAVLIIATAVVVGVGRLLIPYAHHLGPWLEERLSERLGHPVSIDRVEARWPRLTPQIILDGVRAGDDESPLLALDEARLELHLTDLFRTGRNPFRLVVLGLDLVLAEDASGRWGLRLAEGGELAWTPGSGEGLAGDLVVRDVQVSVVPQNAPRLDLIIKEGEIRRRGETTGLVARASPAAAPEAVISLALRGRQGAGGLIDLTGRVSLRRLQLESPGLGSVLPEFVTLPPDRIEASAEFDWQRGLGGSMDLELSLNGAEDFEAEATLRVEGEAGRIDAELIELRSGDRTLVEHLIVAREDDLWAADVLAVSLEDIHRLAGRWFGDWESWPDALAGDVSGLSVMSDTSGSLHRLGGEVTGFTLDMPGDKLRLADLDFDLALDGDRAALSLGGSPTIDWPAKMRQPISMATIEGRAIISPNAVELDRIVGERPEVRGRAEGWVWLGGGRPFVDFTVVAERIGALDPRPWLPEGQIPPRPLAWLDRALLGIEGATGGLNYHFRLGRKFRDWREGDFQAWVDFRGLDLDFWAGWPVARGLDGRADFVGRSMVARVDRGELGAVELGAERIAIDDLKSPELAIALSADDEPAAAVREVLANLPFEGWSRFVDPVEASGPMSLGIDLFLPFARASAWDVGGHVDLQATTLDVPAARLRFPNLRGRVVFDRAGIEPSLLQIADLDPARLTLSAQFESPARLAIEGSLPPSRLLPERSPWSALAGRFDGASRWEAALSGQPSGGWQLELHSDLAGLALDLPKPLGKPASQSVPLDFSLRGHEEGMTLSARLGERLNLVAEDAEGRWRLAAGLGRAAPALPATPGFEVAGAVAQLDLQAWSEALAESSMEAGGGQAGAGRIRLELGQLDYGNLSLRDVALDAALEPAQWQLRLDGPTAAGQVIIPRPIDSGRVVAVDLTRLHLVHSLGPEPGADLAEAPVPAQTRTRVPTDFPPLTLLIESLQYADLDLGRVRMESHARSDGIEIERVDVSGPVLTLSGYGRWILADGGPVTEFEGRLISTELPTLLDRMGQASQFEAARAQVDVEGRWPGAPFDFSLARLDGSMALVMTDGSIPEASPGAGRLLGLASLSAMPRRLMLDFRDVFGEGLKFDRIEGRFELSGGVARTDGLRLTSPAADITMTGETDLGARRYDQTIVVEPGVSGTLPILGGLAGGPAGAAAGLILRSLLERPLQGIAEARYRVTGPWDDPEVALVEALPVEPAPRDDRRAPDVGEPDAGNDEPTPPSSTSTQR